jgi:Fe-S cluster assembly iron-binding protein IscA
MLTVTPSASQALTALLESPEIPDGAGVRIAHGPGPAGEPALGLSIVDGPAPEDIVVDGTGDVDLFLEAQTAEILDDKQLDVEEAAEGIAFTLSPQPLNGGPPTPA